MLERRAIAPSDWYIVGRIAEQLGLRDDAVAAYRRVAREPTMLEVEAATAYAFARRRLARMGVK